MKKLLIITFAILAVGCSKEDYDGTLGYTDEQDEVLMQHLTWFVEDAHAHGVDLDYIYDEKIILKFSNLDSAVGVSWGKWRKGIEIYIDKTEWDLSIPLYQKRLMYHEFGHDILNRSHKRSGIMKSGNWPDSWDLFRIQVRKLFNN